MRNSLLALALALALSGCKDKAKDAPPAATGSGTVAGPVAPADAAMVEPGSGSGSAVGSGSAAAAACKDVEITLAKAGHVVRRDTEQTVKLEEMKDALSKLAAACKGAVVVTANEDMDYQSMITVLDHAKSAGFSDIALDAKDAPKTPAVPRPTTPPPVTNSPIVQVTKKDISIIVGSEPPKVIGAIADVDAAKLDEALAKVPNKRDGTPLIVQADAATSAKTINAIVVAAKKAGFGDLLFAIKNR